MTPDRDLLAAGERMAALTARALQLLQDGQANALCVAALMAQDVLEPAALLPADVRDSDLARGACERARRILGPAQATERH